MRNVTQIIIAALFAAFAATGCSTAEGKNKPMSNESTIVLINPFVVPADKLDETIVMWEQARDFLKQQPGYITTALHQSLEADAQYRLINVAHWESAEAFVTANEKMKAEVDLPRIEGVTNGPALYRVIRGD